MIYLLITLLLLFFIYQYDIRKSTKNRTISYNLTLFILTALAGMRYCIGGDTINYLHSFYHEIPCLYELTLDDFSWDAEPLWTLLNSFVLSFGGRWFIVQFIQALLVNYLIFKYFKRHSEYIYTCVLFYFIWMYIFYVTEELRASISVAICLYANDYFLQKKWWKGYILLLVGCMFHKSTYALLIIPPILFRLRSNVFAAAIAIVAIIGSYIIKSQLGDYIDLISIDDNIDDKLYNYANSDTYGENNRNINAFIIQVLPFLVYPLFALYYASKRKRYDLLSLKPFLILAIIFVAIRSNIEIFYRYFHFYACYEIIFISYLLIDLLKRNSVATIYDRTVTLSLSLTKVCILFFPLFALIGKSYQTQWPRYYPYTSIIQQEIPRSRIQVYSGRSPIKQNEY